MKHDNGRRRRERGEEGGAAGCRDEQSTPLLSSSSDARDAPILGATSYSAIASPTKSGQGLATEDQDSSWMDLTACSEDDPYQSKSSKHHDNGDDEKQQETEEEESMPLFTTISILSTAFTYGCIMTTLFIITLPIECERINRAHPNIPKSVALGLFVAIAGITQLVSPLVGRLSDTYEPPKLKELGQRLPYLVLGSICTVAGLLAQLLASFYGFWIRYSFAFFLHMIGLNIMYGMMIALIPDQVPTHQTGVANGVLALLLVTGSLFGFGLFHSVLYEHIQNMYGLYTCIVIVSSILTGTHGHDKDAELAYLRIKRRRRKMMGGNSDDSDDVAGDDDDDDKEERLEASRQGENAVLASAHRVSNVMGSPESVTGSNYSGSRTKWKRVAKRVHKKAKDVAQKVSVQAQAVTQVIVLGPSIILKSMLVDPFRTMDWHILLSSYTIDRVKYRDFFIVTISRLFYYCGMSVQTFFLYFIHDIIGIHKNPEATVATLAILAQISGAFTCYPIGLLSDRIRRRKPFVYLACAILSSATLLLIFASTLHQMVIFCLVLGAANGIYLTMDTSLAVDTLPKEVEDDDESGSAQLLGIWGVAAFLGSALGPMVGGPLLYLVGSKGPDAGIDVDPTDTSGEAYTLAGYVLVLSLSSFYFLCSAVALLFVDSTHH